jgi:hypothetical protein
MDPYPGNGVGGSQKENSCYDRQTYSFFKRKFVFLFFNGGPYSAATTAAGDL